MAYSCDGREICEQDEHDGCEYHDERVKQAVHFGIGDLSRLAESVSRLPTVRKAPTATELKLGAQYEKAFWRGVENRLEAESERLQRLRRERNELLEACEGLIDVVGLTAFKHENQRACLQDAVDIASGVCAKARKGEVNLSAAIDRLRRQGDLLVASLAEMAK